MKQPNIISPTATPFGVWLRQARSTRGLTMEALSEIADTAPAVISNLERGTRNPSRDMVERLAQALSLDESSDQTSFALLNAGLKAAGFIPVGDEHDEHEVIDYLRGKPEQMQDKALRLLKTAFDEEDAKDNAGNIGKKSE